jgi:F-type H+-transporting ATPase subunit delta
MANRYAKALFEIAVRDGLTEKVHADMLQIRDTLRDKNARDFFSDLSVTRQDKMAAFSTAAPLTQNFLRLVMDKKRGRDLYMISGEFIKMMNDSMNEVEVEVLSPKELTETSRKRLKERLEEKLKKKTDVSFKIDNSIIGGLYIKYGSNIIDGTVNAKLSEIKKELAGA